MVSSYSMRPGLFYHASRELKLFLKVSLVHLKLHGMSLVSFKMWHFNLCSNRH